MKKAKVLSLVLAAALTVGALSSCGSSTSTSTPAASGAGSSASTMTSVKIGLVAPLTGDSGIMGESQRRGYELALTEINAAGGVNGVPIELVTYDDQGDPQKAASGAQKFADDDSILAIGGSCNSSSTLAMVPIIDAAGLPELVVSSSSPKLTGSSDYFFRMSVQDADVGPQMSSVLQSLGSKKIVVFYPNNDYGKGLSQALVTDYTANGGEVLESLTYLPTDQDFTAQVTTALGRNPDAIALTGTPADSGLLIKQLKQMGCSVPILGGTGLYNAKTIEIAGSAAEDVLVIGVYVATNPDETVQELVKKFQAKYDQIPDGFAALAYDQMYVIAAAAKEAMDANNGVVDRDSLQQALKNTNYEGVTGTVTFNEVNDWVRPYLTLQVKNGSYEVYSK